MAHVYESKHASEIGSVPIMMHLHFNSDTSVAHWHDTVKVSQRTSWPAGGAGGATLHVDGRTFHRGMFLNRASVRHHIAATKPCREANMGIREI
jgi:hypothetical protein